MKNKLITVKITEMKYPNIGTGLFENKKVNVKGALPGRTVIARVKRKRSGIIDSMLVSTSEYADYEIEPHCIHQGDCGGCTFQSVPYEKQLELKAAMILNLFEKNGIGIGRWHGIYASPEMFHYRNKMEFSFGDTGKDGALSLGMRKKNSFYEVVTVSKCMIMDEDYGEILNTTVDYFKNTGLTFYNNRKHTGFLRHLVVRKSKRSGEIIVILATTSGIEEKVLVDFQRVLTELNSAITGVIHSENDSVADVVKLDKSKLLFGKGFFYEQILGLTFKITPGSFFQTNTLGAELLYKKTLELAGKCGTVLDLYCGTGTITQIMAKNAQHVLGIELVPEAVQAAKENAFANGIDNVSFICGDVLAVMDTLKIAPDLVILDPPRDGVHQKALSKILELKANKIIYISCKATSLVRDLDMIFKNGYVITDSFAVDMFAWCAHVETVVLLSKKTV